MTARPHPTSFREIYSTTGSVAVVIRQWNHFGESYLLPLFHAVEQLRSRGIKVTFVSFQPSADSKVIGFLREKGEEVLQWVPVRQTIKGFMRSLGKHSLIVSARAHGAMLSSIMGIPCVCIEIEPKLRLIGEQIGARIWSKPYKSQELVLTVKHMLKNENIKIAHEEIVKSASFLQEKADRAEEEFIRYASCQSSGILKRLHRN